jgi:hypothetical protein
MFLVPFQRLRIESAKSPDAVRQALHASIDGDPGFLAGFMPWSGRYVAGTVNDPWFRLVSLSRFRDFYLPITEGTIVREGAATVVQATMRPKLTDMVTFGGLVAFMTILALANAQPLWGPGVLAGVLHLGGCWGFVRARRRVEDILRSSSA